MKRRQFIQASVATSALGASQAAMANRVGTGDPYADAALPQPPNQPVWPAVIIGSGYGGAVSALRLTLKGIPVLMLEMGMFWKATDLPFRPMLTPGKSSLWLKHKNILPMGNFNFLTPYHTGVLDRVEFPNMAVYAGRGFGGGSLVNGGMAVMPRLDYFREVFPDINADEMYQRYFPLASQQLRVNQIDDAFFQRTPWYQYSRHGVAQARKAGFKTAMVPNVYNFRYMEAEATGAVPASALNGEVIFGNNHGKNSLDRTYLADAMRTGNLSLRTLRQVHEIYTRYDGLHEIRIKRLNNSGQVIAEETCLTRSVFLNAGSLGTTEILMRSREKGLMDGLSQEIGEGWGNNGNIMTARNFAGATGAKQSTIPICGIDNWNDPKFPFFAEISPLPLGIETWTSIYLAITRNNNRGRFIYDLGKDRVALHWRKEYDTPSIAAARHLVDRLNASNGGTYAPLLFPHGTGHDFCYHPLGGCLLGKATDNFGRVKGARGIYVTDGSLIPGSLGVNPFLTITALAERNVEAIIASDFA